MRKLVFTPVEIQLVLTSLNNGVYANGQFQGNSIEHLEKIKVFFDCLETQGTAQGEDKGLVVFDKDVVIEFGKDKGLKEMHFEFLKNRFIKQSGGWFGNQAKVVLAIKDKLENCPFVGD